MPKLVIRAGEPPFKEHPDFGYIYMRIEAYYVDGNGTEHAINADHADELVTREEIERRAEALYEREAAGLPIE